MHVGMENPHNRYNISKVKLNRSECERDLGVLVSSDLRSRKQCIEARNRANSVLELLGVLKVEVLMLFLSCIWR